MNNENIDKYIIDTVYKPFIKSLCKIAKKLIIIYSYKFYLKLQENFEIIENKDEFTLLIRKILKIYASKCSLCETKFPILIFRHNH